MKLITYITNPNRQGYIDLKLSAEKYGWELIVLRGDWYGFGTKLLAVRDFLKATDVDRFVFCDGYDCLCVAPPDNFEWQGDFVCSTEKGCWPDYSLNQYYEIHEHGSNFLNSGLYYATKEAFLSVIDSEPPQYTDDDQLYLTKKFLFTNSGITLDYCHNLQCYSFVEDGEFYVNGEFRNVKMSTKPLICHFNGATEHEKIRKFVGV